MNFSINEIKEITLSMLTYPNMDYTNYSISFLKRKFSSVFAKLNIKRKEQLYERLKKKDFRDQLITQMLVENTEMFRDPAFWRLLRDKVIPLLPDNSTVWLPNESSGEEAYSVSVLLNEKKVASKIKIICNNPSLEMCNSINQGHLNGKHFDINLTNYRRLEENDFFDEYFSLENNDLVVCNKLRGNVNCKYGFISDTIPTEDISLILFRNIAIYYNNRLANTVFNILYEKLIPGGYLVIGVKEQLPSGIAEKMITVNETEKIFKKPLAQTNGYS